FVVIYLQFFYGRKDDAGIFLEYDKTFDPYVLLFFLAAVLSTIFSINPLVSYWGHYERSLGLAQYIYIILIYFFSIYIFNDERRIVQAFSAIELTAVAVSVYTVLQYLNLNPFEPEPNIRPSSTLGNPVFTGGFLAMILPFSTLNTSRKKYKVLKIIFPLIILSGIIVTGTRSAYLALGAEVLFFAIFYHLVLKSGNAETGKKIRFILLLLGAAIVLLIVFILLLPANPFSHRVLSIFASGNNPRWILWRDAYGIFKKYPVFGPGIAMFPDALEEFYSYRLRMEDVKSYFDNAHNNFLQTLYTMGIVGFILYLLIIFQAIKSCLKKLLSKEESKGNRIMFLSFLLMISGYAVYGLTNFDDITILFYFFVFIALLRAVYIKNPSAVKLKKGSSYAVMVLPVLMIVFLCYNAFNAFNFVRADSFFMNGTVLISTQRFNEGISEMNKAISLNPECAPYRFILAENIYKLVSAGGRIRPDIKRNMLQQAADETQKAKGNYFNKNECDAQLSLIYYEMGKINEADSIKNEVLQRDSVNINFRLNLALYYLKSNNLAGVKEQLDVVLGIDYNNINSWNIAAIYYTRINDTESVKMYCRKILERDPENPIAKDLMKKIQ